MNRGVVYWGSGQYADVPFTDYTSGGEHILDHMDHVDVKNIGLG